MKNSIIHIYIYGMIRREVTGGNIIHISKIHPVIKWIVRLPRKYQIDVIKELVEIGLLKKIDRDHYEIISINKSPPFDSLGDPLWK